MNNQKKLLQQIESWNYKKYDGFITEKLNELNLKTIHIDDLRKFYYLNKEQLLKLKTYLENEIPIVKKEIKKKLLIFSLSKPKQERMKFKKKTTKNSCCSIKK